MNKKLTLRLEDDLIDFAKKYSTKTGKPVSRIVANLFETMKNEKANEKNDLSPTVKALKGILKSKEINETDYKKHLEEKYL